MRGAQAPKRPSVTRFFERDCAARYENAADNKIKILRWGRFCSHHWSVRVARVAKNMFRTPASRLDVTMAKVRQRLMAEPVLNNKANQLATNVAAHEYA